MVSASEVRTQLQTHVDTRITNVYEITPTVPQSQFFAVEVKKGILRNIVEVTPDGDMLTFYD